MSISHLVSAAVLALASVVAAPAVAPARADAAIALAASTCYEITIVVDGRIDIVVVCPPSTPQLPPDGAAAVS